VEGPVTTHPSGPHLRAAIIAIDGPAASGKSAVGGAVATKLDYRFFDTGAMYRAVTWLALQLGVDVHDPDALETLIEEASITVREAPPGSAEATLVLVDGSDATPHLRDSGVEANVSLVSRVPGVRAALVGIQRELAKQGAVVMAGRDIGTVVLPGADLKVYLDASREVRARRRMQQVAESGGQADPGVVMADLERRDGIDSSRDASPLTAAPDAVIINTDTLTLDEVVQRIVELAT
jgi:cytidylate kinase